MKRILLVILAAVLMINSGGCMKSGNNKNQAQIGIRGQITKLLVNDSKSVYAVMVEGKVESDTIYDKASVGIDKSTMIFKGKTDQKLSASDLNEGMKVEVVFDGPVAESYPVQGKAKTIRVME